MDYYSALKREFLLCAPTWINLEDIMLSEINQSRTNIHEIHFHEVPKMVKLLEAERRIVGAPGEQGGSGDVLINGYKVSVTQGTC